MARTQNTVASNVNAELTGAQKAAATRAANKAIALAAAEAEAAALALAERKAKTAATRAANKAAREALAASAVVDLKDPASVAKANDAVLARIADEEARNARGAKLIADKAAAKMPGAWELMGAPAAAPAAPVAAPAITVEAFFPQAPAAAPAAPTTRTPEQQAALDEMRAKAAAKAAAAPQPQAAPEPAAASVEVDAETYAMIEALPSGKRVLVGFLLGIASAFSVGYGIGCILSYALAGIMVLTSTAWVAFTLSVLAWIIAIYASWKIGGYVGGKVFSSVVMPDGLASRSMTAVSSMFSSGKEKVSDVYAEGKQRVGAFVKPAARVVAA